MNERQEQTADVLGKLTVLGTIVLPMNIITGMWGMNVLVPGQEVQNLYWFWSSKFQKHPVRNFSRSKPDADICQSRCWLASFWHLLLLHRKKGIWYRLKPGLELELGQMR